MTLDEALHSIKKGDLVALRRALDDGLDPDAAPLGGWTLLMVAASEGHTPIGELLHSRGADVNAEGHLGVTALYLAAHHGHIKFVRWLLSVDVSRDCRPYGHALDEVVIAGSGLPDLQLSRVLNLIRPDSHP